MTDDAILKPLITLIVRDRDRPTVRLTLDSGSKDGRKERRNFQSGRGRKGPSTCELDAAFVSLSANSFPWYPLCPSIHPLGFICYCRKRKYSEV